MRSLPLGLFLMIITLTAPVTAAEKVSLTIDASKVNSVNTVEAPNAVVPKPVSAIVEGGKLTLKLEHKSVTVISIEQ